MSGEIIVWLIICQELTLIELSFSLIRHDPFLPQPPLPICTYSTSIHVYIDCKIRGIYISISHKPLTVIHIDANTKRHIGAEIRVSAPTHILRSMGIRLAMYTCKPNHPHKKGHTGHTDKTPVVTVTPFTHFVMQFPGPHRVEKRHQSNCNIQNAWEEIHSNCARPLSQVSKRQFTKPVPSHNIWTVVANSHTDTLLC